MKILMGAIWIILLQGFICSCHSSRADEQLETALEMAGDNRAELESVLLYYRNDSLKQQAAKFLIRNMTGYYSYQGTVMDSLYIALKQFVQSASYEDVRLRYLQSFSYKQMEKVGDLQHITAAYLIENIDYSFKVWRERPWGKFISFDDFCELILPYRIKNESLTHWKKDLYEKFTPVLDSLYQGTDVVEACTRLNRYLVNRGWNYSSKFNSPHLAADFLVEHRVGDCEDMSDYAIYIMRAVGLPVAKDCYFYSPAKMYAHYWNVLLDTTGVMLSFFNREGDPQRGRQISYPKGKVYRHCFAPQQESLSLMRKGYYVPRPLTDFTLKDVSADYFPTTDIYVDCDYMESSSKCPVWLAVFTHRGWLPIDVGEYKDGKACFRNVEAGFYYVVLHYDKTGKQQLVAPAFKIDFETGVVLQLRPEGNSERLVLRRKYPMSSYQNTFVQRMQRGRFEASDKLDFSNVDTLYRIKDVPTPKYHDIQVESHKKYRYVRYVSDNNSPADISELYWYGKQDIVPLTGKLINTAPVNMSSRFRPENIQDGDRLTYFTSASSPGWIGMDFGKPIALERIVYMPRNDDNYIRSGDRYELFYLASTGWESLGCKVADSEELMYDNAPRHAWFLLRNLTRGHEELPFAYFNGKQYFNLREVIY